MSQCVEFVADQLQATATSIEECTGFALLSAFEYAQLAVGYEITPESIAYVWVWGFGSVATPWASAYAIMWVKKTIKLL